MKWLLISISIVLMALLLSVSFGQELADDDLGTEQKASPIAPAKKLNTAPIPSEVPTESESPASEQVADEFQALESPVTELSSPKTPKADTPEPSIPFSAVMYVIEADWSKANNREQAWIELKAAFQELKFSKTEEAELFTRAPQILFGPTTVSYYKPNHASSLIQWLARHGLIRSVVVSSPARVNTNKRAVYGAFNSDGGHNPKLSANPGDVGLVIRDNHDAVPIVPPSQFNLGELSHRAFRQVWWLQLNHREGMPVIDSSLFFEKKSDQEDGSNNPNPVLVMEELTPVDIIDLPRTEVAFFNAFSSLPVNARSQAARSLIHHFEHAKQKGVFPVIAISRGFDVEDSKSELRLPDRVDIMKSKWDVVNSTVQLSTIDLPNRIPFLREQNRLNSSTPPPFVTPEIEPSAPGKAANVERVNGTLEIVRKRYLEAEARAIALAQKHVTEPVDKDLFLKAVAETFVLRQEVHRLELQQLLDRVEGMKQKIQARDVRRAEIIERRVDELMKLGKHWHSTKPGETDVSVQPPLVEPELNVESGVVVTPRPKAKQRVDEEEIVRRRLLSELIQDQSARQPANNGAAAGGIIDMSDRKRWARPSTTPELVDHSNDQADIDAQKSRSLENLQKLMRALLDYEKDHKRFPAAVVERKIDGKGSVLHSWRVEILPYLGRKDLFESYKMDEPWDSPDNLKVLEQMPDLFASPLDDSESTNTSYFAVVTPYLKAVESVSPRPNRTDERVNDLLIEQSVILQYQNGTVFSDPKGTRLDTITDGPHRTIALVEVKRPIPWTQPLDIEFSNDLHEEWKLWYSDGWCVAYADGSVRQLSTDNSANLIDGLLRIDDQDQLEPKVILRRMKRRQNPSPQNAPQTYDPIEVKSPIDSTQ